MQQMLLAVGEGPKQYVDEYFDINVYDGNSSSQTLYINKKNNTALTDKYAIWVQNRTTSGYGSIFGTSEASGSGYIWNMHTNSGLTLSSGCFNSFTPSSNQIAIGGNDSTNRNGDEYVAWTWSKRKGFFDTFYYSGNGSGSRTISHSLGADVGAALIMPDSSGGDRCFWHRKSGSGGVGLKMNSTAGSTTNWISSSNSSSITVHSDLNQSGRIYYVNLWAHDHKKFGENADESIVYCGEILSSNGSEQKITLGWQPRWILLKNRESADTSGSNEVGKGNWIIMDTERNMGASGQSNFSLKANSTSTEDRTSTFVRPVSDGFHTKSLSNSNDKDVVFIAIKDSGDKPWSDFPSSYQIPAKMVTYSGTGNALSVNFGTGFNIHEASTWYRHNNGTYQWGGNTSPVRPKRRPVGTNLFVNSIGGDTTVTNYRQTNPRSSDHMIDRKTSQVVIPSGGNSNASNGHYFALAFQKMRGLVDFVTYKALSYPSSSVTHLQVKHHLGVVPRMMFVGRADNFTNNDAAWHNIRMYCADVPNANQKGFKYTARSTNHGIYDGTTTYNAWNNTSPTATHFTVKTGMDDVHQNYATEAYHAAMLVADAAGKIKSGKWDATGQNNTQSINMGFSPSMIFIWNLHGAGNYPSVYYGEGDSYVWFPSADPKRLHLVNRHNSSVDTDNYSYYRGFIPVQQMGSGFPNAPLAGSISMSGNNLQVTNFLNRNTNRDSVSEVYSWYYLAIK